MPSLFAAEVLEATAACDEVMAEPFLLKPKVQSKNTNVPAVDDPNRTATLFLATFRDPEAKPLIPNAYDSRTDLRPGTQSSIPRIQVTPFEIARTGLVINDDDLIIRESDARIWKVRTTTFSTSGVLRAEVNLIG